MQQLTNEEITKVFAGYIGCEATYNNKINNHQGKILGVDAVGNVILSHKSVLVPYKVCDIGYSSMLLTPLSSITDEHAIEVAKMFGMVMASVRERTSKCVFLVDDTHSLLIGFDCHVTYAKNGFMHSEKETSLVVQRLAKLGYAIPLDFGHEHWANGKTAIQLGIAIDKTQTT